MNVVSFNIGSYHDWKNLVARDVLMKTDGTCKMEPRDDPNYLEKFRAKIFEETKQITKEDVYSAHDRAVNDFLNRLLSATKPAFVCLQEYFYEDPYSSIRDRLHEHGYEILGANGLGIAYKMDSFEIQNNPIFSFDPEKFMDMELSLRSSLYCDFKERSTGRTYRVVTDHVKGFNGKDKKSQSKEHVDMPRKYEERMQFHADRRKRSVAVSGDLSLDMGLAGVDLPTKGLASSFLRASRLSKAPVVIYALDANAAAKHTEERLHPKRLRLFDLWGYKGDREAKQPTIIDANDFIPRKYDYIFAKSSADVKIVELHLPELNDPELLNTPGRLMSDHLPVIARVEIPK